MKASVEKRYKAAIKTLGTIEFAALLSVGGLFLASCSDQTEKPTTPPTTPPAPVEPVDPPEDKDKILLETATGEYKKILANIVKANSLTSFVETTNGDNAKIFEIQDNKVKLTENQEITYVESTQGQAFEYTLQGNEWHKNVSTVAHTAQTIKTSLCETLEGVEWTSAKQENNQITLNGKTDVGSSKLNVSCQYNTKDNSLILITPNQTTSVYNVDATLVNLPTQFVDDTQEQPPVEEEFKITEDNIEAVKAAMRPHVENICHRATKRSELQDVFSVYLTKSEGSSVVDTIGAVYTLERTDLGGIYLKWVELTIPTQKDITYKDIYKQNLNYDINATSHKTLYTFSSTNEEKSPIAVSILKSQTLGDNYTTADWTGWTGSTRLGQDPHTIIMFKDNIIYEYNIEIKRSNSTLNMLEVIKENFLGKEPSKDTYSQVLKTYNVYEGDKEFLAIQAQEKE